MKKKNTAAESDGMSEEDIDALIIKRGRPATLKLDYLTLRLIDKLARIHCTQSEIAGVLGVRRETFNRWMSQNDEARVTFEEGFEHGSKSLRRAQFEVAIQDKNPTMLIWLGKQYLGQRDQNDMRAEVKVVDLTAVDVLRKEIEAMVVRQLPPPMKTIN